MCLNQLLLCVLPSGIYFHARARTHTHTSNKIKATQKQYKTGDAIATTAPPETSRGKHHCRACGLDNHSPCGYHIVGNSRRPNDPNALFSWLGTWHIMFQHNGGWGHVVSKNLASWSTLSKKALAIDGPNAWDGSLSFVDGKPVAIFDCTSPARDRVGYNRSCNGLNTTNVTRGLGIGDPSFLGIARPVDYNDPNLTAMWHKDPRAPISVLNESGLPAGGYSGPSPIWTSSDGVKNLIMTYGKCSTLPRTPNATRIQ